MLPSGESETRAVILISGAAIAVIIVALGLPVDAPRGEPPKYQKPSKTPCNIFHPFVSRRQETIGETVGRYLRLQRFRLAFALTPRRDAAGFLAALALPAFFCVLPALVFLDVFLAALAE